MAGLLAVFERDQLMIEARIVVAPRVFMTPRINVAPRVVAPRPIPSGRSLIDDAPTAIRPVPLIVPFQGETEETKTVGMSEVIGDGHLMDDVHDMTGIYFGSILAMVGLFGLLLKIIK